MFRIGEFSRFSQVTVKTLRYYDEIGLLKPARVDPFTSYRYYSAAQLPRLNRILALKELGLSLDQIGDLLDGELSADQIRGILKLKRSEIQDHVREEQARLVRVETRLKQIEQENVMPTQEIVVKKVPAQLVASVRDVIPIQAISGLFDELFGHLGRHGAGPAGPPIGIYHSEEFREEGNDTEIAAPVASTIPDGERVGCRELPAIDAAACVIHEGGYETIGGSYGRLMGWVEAHGYRIAGPVREIYLRGPESGDPAGYVTEIQLPVAEA